MPEISRFLGIIITMYFAEHDPPHFHARYGSHKITVGIENRVVTGEFPRRELQFVLQWHSLHKDELLENWRLSRQRLVLNKIEPLE